jgi:hypothetical protein
MFHVRQHPFGAAVQPFSHFPVAANRPRMRADRLDKVERAAELHAASLDNKVIAERLGISTSVPEYLERAKLLAAKE